MIVKPRDCQESLVKRGGRNSSGVPLTWLSGCQCVFGGKGDKEMTWTIWTTSNGSSWEGDPFRGNSTTDQDSAWPGHISYFTPSPAFILFLEARPHDCLFCHRNIPTPFPLQDFRSCCSLFLGHLPPTSLSGSFSSSRFQFASASLPEDVSDYFV